MTITAFDQKVLSAVAEGNIYGDGSVDAYTVADRVYHTTVSSHRQAAVVTKSLRKLAKLQKVCTYGGATYRVWA